MRHSIGHDKDDEVVPWLESIDETEEQHGTGQHETTGDNRPQLTRGQLIRISTGMLGLMFGWAMKTVLTTPLFRDVYGVETADLGFIWLAGPLSGLIVQPVIGVISDHREQAGQRSLFFAMGAVFMSISLAMLPSAGTITRALTGKRTGNSDPDMMGSHGEPGVGLAIAAFWLLDLAMNASLVTIRAIIADSAPPEQQPEANTAIIISYGTGTFLGYGFGAVNAAHWLGLRPGSLGKACVDFGTAAFVLLVTAAIAFREAFLLEQSHTSSLLSRSPSPSCTNDYTTTIATPDVLGAHRSSEGTRGVGDPALSLRIEADRRQLPTDDVCAAENEGREIQTRLGNESRCNNGVNLPGAVTRIVTASSSDARHHEDVITGSGLDEPCSLREAFEGIERGESPGAVVNGTPRGGDRPGNDKTTTECYGRQQEKVRRVSPQEEGTRGHSADEVVTASKLEHRGDSRAARGMGGGRCSSVGGQARGLRVGDGDWRRSSEILQGNFEITCMSDRTRNGGKCGMGRTGVPSDGKGDSRRQRTFRSGLGHGVNDSGIPLASSAVNRNKSNGAFAVISGNGSAPENGAVDAEARAYWASNCREETGGKHAEARGSDASALVESTAAAGAVHSRMKVQGSLLEMILFYDVPGWLRPVCWLLFFTWVGWFAIIIFGSDWVGVDVFGGDPSAPEGNSEHQAYEDGVAWASVGLAAQALVIGFMGCGPVTWLVRNTGMRGSFLTAVLSQSALMLVALFVREGTWGKTLSLMVLAGLGVPLALIESLPYMMVGMLSPREIHGQLLGKLNVWIVLAQLALTLCINPIVKHVEDGDVSVLAAGFMTGVIGLLFVPAIDRQRKEASTSPSEPCSAGGEAGACVGVCESGTADCPPGSPRRALLR